MSERDSIRTHSDAFNFLLVFSLDEGYKKYIGTRQEEFSFILHQSSLHKKNQIQSRLQGLFVTLNNWRGSAQPSAIPV